MQLMTKQLLKRFTQVGRQEHAKDPIVIAKFFNPTGAGTWYATEYDPETRTASSAMSPSSGTGTTSGAASRWMSCKATAAASGWASNATLF
jgi:hypothetical protein